MLLIVRRAGDRLSMSSQTSQQSMRGWRSTVGNLIEIVWLQQKLSLASVYWHMRETQRGTVSSNSRFRTVLFQQYSANLSVIEGIFGCFPSLARGNWSAGFLDYILL